MSQANGNPSQESTKQDPGAHGKRTNTKKKKKKIVLKENSVPLSPSQVIRGRSTIPITESQT